MGSFYSTCSISNMTLSSQKTSIQLLVPGYSTDYKEHMGMVVSNDGAQCFFSPFAFPIHGVYDDYGYIHSIKRDKNVEMLEEYFGVDIDSIIQNVGSRDTPDGIKNEDTFNMLGMTYFRTEVLEYVQRGWDGINHENPKKYTGGERLSKLFRQLEKNKGKTTTDKLEELQGKKRDKTITDDEFDELLDMMSSFSDYTMKETTYIASLAKLNMFLELPITMEFKDDMLKQYQFLMTLGYELSRSLLPSNYGSQQTNWTSQYKLNEFVNDILVEDMKKDIEYDDDPEYYLKEREIVKDHFMLKRDKKINSVLD